MALFSVFTGKVLYPAWGLVSLACRHTCGNVLKARFMRLIIIFHWMRKVIKQKIFGICRCLFSHLSCCKIHSWSYIFFQKGIIYQASSSACGCSSKPEGVWNFVIGWFSCWAAGILQSKLVVDSEIEKCFGNDVVWVMITNLWTKHISVVLCCSHAAWLGERCQPSCRHITSPGLATLSNRPLPVHHNYEVYFLLSRSSAFNFYFFLSFNNRYVLQPTSYHEIFSHGWAGPLPVGWLRRLLLF